MTISYLGYSPTYRAPISILLPALPVGQCPSNAIVEDITVSCGTGYGRDVFLTTVTDLGGIYSSTTGTISFQNVQVLNHHQALCASDETPDPSFITAGYLLETSTDGNTWATFNSFTLTLNSTNSFTEVVNTPARYLRMSLNNQFYLKYFRSASVNISLTNCVFSWDVIGSIIPPPPPSTGTVTPPISPSGTVIYPVSGCLPGILEQSPGFLNGLFLNDAHLPLINYGRSIFDGFPDWFSQTNCTLLKRTVGVIGQSLDEFQNLFDQKEYIFSPVDKNFTEGDEYEFNLPQELIGKEFSVSGTTVVNKTAYYSSYGYCACVFNDVLRIRNYSRQIDYIQSTGSVLSLSGLSDYPVLYTQDSFKYLQPYRWNRAERNSYLPSGNIAVSSVQSIPNNITLVLIYNNKVYIVTGKKLKKSSFFDLGLYRFNISNYTYESLYNSRSLHYLLNNVSSHRSLVIGQMGSELNSINVIKWFGESLAVTGNLVLSKDLLTEYRRELIEINSVSSRQYTYLLSKSQQSNSRLAKYNQYTDTLFTGVVTGNIAEFILPKYTQVNNTLTGLFNLYSYIGVVTGFVITSLSLLSKSRLFVSGKPSLLLKDISTVLNKKNTVTYSNSKWSGFSSQSKSVIIKAFRMED